MSAVSSGSAAMADHVLVLVNPRAGSGSVAGQIDHFVGLLRRRGFRVELSSDLDAVCQRANEAYRAGALRALVAVGGDGTAAELVNRTDLGLPITLYPAGTSNLIARYLGLVPSPHRLCETIASRSLLKLDAALASGRVWLMNASCGLDAHVVHQLHHEREGRCGGHITYWSYVKPILEAIRNYQYPEIRVCWDDGGPGPSPRWSGLLTVRWAFVFNLPLYGWGLPLANWADGADGLLDVCAFRRGGLWHGLRYLALSQLGWHRRLGACTVVRAARLRITADRPVAYQLDGDPGGWLPLDVEILPGRLTFVIPASSKGWSSAADRI